MAKYTMEIPDRLNEQFTEVADESNNSKSEIVRKALQLYIAAHKATLRGDLVGIVDRNSRDALKTEIIGL